MTLISDIAKLEAEIFSDPWTEESLNDTFEYDYNHLLVEKRDGRLVGYIIYSEVQGEAELLRVAVEKSYRRKGIARKLIKGMLRELREFEAVQVFPKVDFS